MDNGKPHLLIDNYVFKATLLEDKRATGGKMIARGEFARADIATENKRLYPRSLWEREIARISKQMQEGKIYGEVDHPCLLDDDFSVMTVAGWRKFRDVKVGDRVFSRVNGKAVVSTVEGIVDRPYEGKAYRVQGRSIDSGFTPAHKFLLVKRPGDPGYGQEVMVTLEEIVANRPKFGHHAIPKTATFFSESPETITIPGVQSVGRTKNDVSQPLVLDAKLFAAFMGIYLSEGCCSTGKDYDKRVEIAQKKQWSRDLIRDEILSKFPTDLQWNACGDDSGFWLTDARLYAYLKPLGDCYSKFIPEEVKHLSAGALKELIYWFTIGDGRMVAAGPGGAGSLGLGEKTYKEVQSEAIRNGDITNSRQDVFSVSAKLVRDLHECLIRSGGAGSLSTVLPGEDYVFADHLIEAKNKVPLYQLHISNTENIWADQRNLRIEEVQHKGNIYCLSTTHGSFYMEQNGKSFWTGNSDGRTSLKRVSHLITGLSIQNGIVVGEAQIMDTEAGKTLKAIFEAGGQVGVSSRGFGTTRPNTEGIDVVQEDYKLMTFDFVAEPANVTSYPSINVEDKNKSKEPVMAESKTLDSLKKTNPALYESFMQDAEREYEKRGAEIWAKKIMGAKDEVATDLRASFAEQLQQAIKENKAEMEKQIRSSLLKDPKVAGAKTALENVVDLLKPYLGAGDSDAASKKKDNEIAELSKKLGEQTEAIARLSEENKQLAELAKEAGYRYHLESQLNGNPYADLLRKMVGDVKQYESKDSLNAKIVECAEMIKKSQEKHEARDRALDSLREENEQLRKANEKALEAAKLLSLQNYVEARLLNHPRAADVRLVMESANITSKDDIDNILGKFRERKQDVHALDEARARVRALVGSQTREYITEAEEKVIKDSGATAVNYNGLGTSAGSLRTLAGIDQE